MKILLSFLVLLAVSTGSQAQQGHPLDGIWLGDWGTSASDRNQVVVELSWHDTSLSGNINPGYPDQATVETGELASSEGWKVHIVAVGKAGDGKEFMTVLDGQLDESNLGSANRTMTGTWTQAGITGNFSLRRE